MPGLPRRLTINAYSWPSTLSPSSSQPVGAGPMGISGRIPTVSQRSPVFWNDAYVDSTSSSPLRGGRLLLECPLRPIVACPPNCMHACARTSK